MRYAKRLRLRREDGCWDRGRRRRQGQRRWCEGCRMWGQPAWLATGCQEWDSVTCRKRVGVLTIVACGAAGWWPGRDWARRAAGASNLEATRTGRRSAGCSSVWHLQALPYGSAAGPRDANSISRRLVPSLPVHACVRCTVWCNAATCDSSVVAWGACGGEPWWTGNERRRRGAVGSVYGVEKGNVVRFRGVLLMLWLAAWPYTKAPIFLGKELVFLV